MDMRGILFAILLSTVPIGVTAFSEEAPAAFRNTSLSELDAHIKEVKEQIRVYRNRAVHADRDAQRLMGRDFSSYRRHLIERDRDLETVDALKKELQILEQQRAALTDSAQNSQPRG